MTYSEVSDFISRLHETGCTELGRFNLVPVTKYALSYAGEHEYGKLTVTFAIEPDPVEAK